MFEAILSLATGGLLGGALNLVKEVINLFRQRQANKQELALLETRTRLKIQLNKARIDGEIDLEETKAFTEGVKGLAQERPLVQTVYIEEMMKHWYSGWLAALLIILMGLIDVVKAAIRPGLTIYLMGGATYVIYVGQQILDKVLGTSGIIMPVEKLMDLNEIATLAVLHLAGVAAGFYFSDRGNAKFIQEMYKQKGFVEPEPEIKRKVGLKKRVKNLWTGEEE